ncbi:MAG TPA: DUF418 domain-containing protein, partial [Cytophagales bacterium]|nr:DUF418 domain-containing protein [Cytophagales bacterium]
PMTLSNTTTRIHVVDALRGFALAGVALVHMVEQYIAGPTPEGFMEGMEGLPDQIVQGLLQVFFIGKFFGLFSILFGLSFSIQLDAAAQKGTSFMGRFLWRSFLLFLIGYVHQLFYRGDILTIYALLVPFFIPFHRLQAKWILVAAALCFLSLPRLISYALFGNSPFFGLPEGFVTPQEQAYFQVIESGSLLEVMEQNAGYGFKAKMNFQLQIFGRIYYTLGYFLIGLWLGKMHVFQRIADLKRPLVKALLWCLVALVVSFAGAGALFSTAPQPVDFSSWHHALAMNVFDWTNLSMTILILLSFLLLYRKSWWQRRLSSFAPYGRMALSNYLLQSLVGTALLFGWGLGYLGHIRSLYLFIMALLLIALQSWGSKLWLRHFRYGPLEWLWRSGTYLKWQPLRKPKAQE